MKLRSTRSVLIVLLPVMAAAASQWVGLTPQARCAARMARDCANQRIILFGGTSVYYDGRYFNDVWQFGLDSNGECPLSRLSVSGTPPCDRDDGVMVYDPVGRRMILFGGSAGIGSRLNDVWALNLTRGSESWQQLSPSGTPPSARHFCYYIYYPVRRSVIVFGGEDSAGTGDLNDVWELGLDSLAWHEINPSGTLPSTRMDGGAAYDATNNRMIIFGGRPGNGFTSEVWALDLESGSEHWTKLSPSGSGPSARAGFAYAQGGDKLYVSCGWDGDYYFNDLYVLDIPTLTWSQVNPSSDAPWERRNTTGAWDEIGQRFFIFGGEAGGPGYYVSDAYCIGFVGQAGGYKPLQSPASASFLSIAGIANGVVRIHCLLAQAGLVDVRIVDASGRLVSEAYSGPAVPPGMNLEWDGRDMNGHSVPAGSYYCSLETGGKTQTRKFVYTR